MKVFRPFVLLVLCGLILPYSSSLRGQSAEPPTSPAPGGLHSMRHPLSQTRLTEDSSTWEI